MPRFHLLAILVLAGTVAIPALSAQAPPPPPAGWVLEDDMYLPEEVVFGESAFQAAPWPAGYVPYTFNVSVDPVMRSAALRAMAEVSGICRVTFAPRTTQPNWIEFNAATVNSSPVGMAGGGQTINITSWGTKYIIVHEIMHALGYIHEQSRPDRDTYVTINWTNIQGPSVNNFFQHILATMATPYDFLSIMQYGRNDFSINGMDTITCQPAYAQFQANTAASPGIGNRTFLSLGDAQGLQQRYLTPLGPELTAIGPTSVTTSGGSFTLNVIGARFFEGSPNANGVQGTKVRWNGILLPTTWINEGYVTAQVPAAYVSRPGTAQITVINPAPAGGAALNSLPLMVNCQTNTLVLSPGVPSTVTNGCQIYALGPPAYNAFNVVAVSSPSDWDIQMGSASAAAGGNTCDFVAGSGFFGASTVTPNTGNVILYDGYSPGTLQYEVSTPLLNGQPTISSLPAGSIVKAFHFNTSAPSYHTIAVAGPSDLRWKLLWGGNSFGWRGSTGSYVSAQGVVGGPPVQNIGAGGGVCLVVYRDGGPAAVTEDFTVTMCFNFTPQQLYSGGTLTVNQGAYSCQWFTIAPLTGKWNVVGVSSPTDWDIQIGSAVSQYPGAICDYVLANGHLGGVSPVTGVTSPYSVPFGSPATLQFAPTATMTSNPGYSNSYTTVIVAFEFLVTTPGNYDVTVGIPGLAYQWDLHRPGSSSAWRRKVDRSDGPFLNTGSPITFTNLDAGWHCVVAYHNGGPTGLANPWIAVSPSNHVPSLSSISPATAAANSGTFNLTASGFNFTTAFVVRWNGAALPTSFVSATELLATVDGALLAAPGTAQITVFNPGAGGASSTARTFTITNPVPVLAGVSPASIGAGGPATTILANGGGFTSQCVVVLGGVPLATSLVSASQLSAAVPAALMAVPTTAQVTVESPAPGGGTSAGVAFAITAPAIVDLAPASIAIMSPVSVPVPVTVTGSGFVPGCRVIANGIVLATTFVSATQLTGALGPAVLQTGRPGAIALTVENVPAVVSNTKALVVGSGGANQGTIRRHELVPAPGQAYSALLEGGAANGLFSLYVDLANVPPVTQFPIPAADFVLAVGPYAGSPGPFLPLVEGIGIHGPPTGQTLNAQGAFSLPGFILPNPAWGLELTVQGIYLDPGAPFGFRLTWARWPDRL